MVCHSDCFLVATVTVTVLGPRLQAAAGRMLYDTSAMERPTTLGNDSDTAAILEGTQLCCTCQMRDILHCLGGVSVLLPLVGENAHARSLSKGQRCNHHNIPVSRDQAFR